MDYSAVVRWPASGARVRRWLGRGERVDSGRQLVLNAVADAVQDLRGHQVHRVGVDGVDGAGKTVFADELAHVLTARGAAVIRASIDGFHNSREDRYRMGRSSPEGFFRDSYDYGRLRDVLLDPLSPGGSYRFKRAVYDVERELPVEAEEERATPGHILVVDGIFLHRPELRPYWDYSVFLDVDFEVSIPRGALRGMGSPDPRASSNRRYVEGQRLYLDECTPQAYASVVIDNNDLAEPVIVMSDP
jgi:uridine kinase